MRIIDQGQNFLVAEKIGKRQALTPEGFLLCEGVAIARTGEQVYGPNETPVKPATPGDIVMIVRSPDEVFRPETLASFEGKDIVDDHPVEDVGPDNWRTLAVGHVQNVRRGEDAEADFMFADFLIKDAAAIAAVRAGKREVSCGYDADYEQIGPGRGRQINIIGNHVALVERGRCGPRCAIGDSEMPKKLTMRDRMVKFFKVKDAEELEKMMDEELPESGEEPMPNGGVVIHNHASDAEEKTDMKETKDMIADLAARMGDVEGAIENMDKKYRDAFPKKDDDKDDDKDDGDTEDKAILGQLEFEAPPGTGDKARKARDSAYLVDSFQDTVAGAEILMPGIKIPTFDRVHTPKTTFDAICALRKAALEGSTTDAAVAPLLEGFDLKRASCGDVRTLFRSAVTLKKAANTNATFDRTGFVVAGSKDGAKPMTPAELNKRNAERYGRSA